ncbi:hypothetical protein UCDDA912_g04764 [Diaporthe ampelina]|uniref:Uncharacterized protein n=1 Tax=Diaporthe ampelina TaxID=1214573 RepID=A0A0G2FMI4_9PEZI|nr:hypothetical protein UCDDA912_g04764 [Diaporthe ampelina]
MATAGSTTRAASECEGGVATGTGTGTGTGTIIIVTIGAPGRRGGAYSRDTVGPGGTIEEAEEGGTAPAAHPLTATTAVVPVAAAADPYDVQQPHTHYHLNDDNGGRRRARCGYSHTHGRRQRRRHGDTHDDDDGVLRLVERERRRDCERHMADADVDASNRRGAMMMGLVGRERDRDRDRDYRHGGGGGGGDEGGTAGLDARERAFISSGQGGRENQGPCFEEGRVAVDICRLKMLRMNEM